MLLPVIIATGIVSFALSQPLEIAFFGGNMPLWLTDEIGITYDQRNSLVVGIAMGFAVIPIIFTICEDAVFGVPEHLTMGSLALGATPLADRSESGVAHRQPGNLLRGNDRFRPGGGRDHDRTHGDGKYGHHDMNIFEGFRTLSANIAVEMQGIRSGQHPLPYSVPGRPGAIPGDVPVQYRCRGRQAETPG